MTPIRPDVPPKLSKDSREDTITPRKIKPLDVQTLPADKGLAWDVKWTLNGQRKSKTCYTQAEKAATLTLLRDAIAQFPHAEWDAETGLPITGAPTERLVDFAIAGITGKRPKYVNLDRCRCRAWAVLVCTATRRKLTDNEASDAYDYVYHALLNGDPKPQTPEATRGQRLLQQHGKRLNELTEKDMIDALETIASSGTRGRLKDSSVDGHRIDMNLLITHAASERKIAADVAKKLVAANDRGKEVDQKPVTTTLTGEQVMMIADAIGSGYRRAHRRRYRAYVLAIYFTGCRPGEAALIRRDNVQFQPDGTAIVHVEKARKTDLRNSAKVSEGAPKTFGRPIPVPVWAADVLREHIAEFVPEGGNPLLFCQPNGGIIRPNDFCMIFRQTIETLWPKVRYPEGHPLAGQELPENEQPWLTKVVPYSLRHAGLSHLLKSTKLHPKHVTKISGHTRESTLVDTYWHPTETLVEAMSDHLSQSTAPGMAPATEPSEQDEQDATIIAFPNAS